MDKDLSAKKEDCSTEKGSEKKGRRVWGTPRDAESPETEQCLVLPPELICREAPFTRTNHLGRESNERIEIEKFDLIRGPLVHWTGLTRAEK